MNPCGSLVGKIFVSFLNAKFLGSLCEDKKNSIHQLIKQSKCYIHSTVHSTLQYLKKKKKGKWRVKTHSRKGRLTNPKKYSGVTW